MTRALERDEIGNIAPAGHYLALRVGFAFPMEEINAFPEGWIAVYTRERFMMHDPVTRWVYTNFGAIRWSAIPLDDPMRVFDRMRDYGLMFGAAVSCISSGADGLRSFGSFARSDREFRPDELDALELFVRSQHEESTPPDNLTRAELEVLAMVKEGLRLKQIAYDLGVSEGAIKQRLKNAKAKLGAATGAQAATKAATFGLI